MLLSTIRRWFAVAVMSLLLVTMSLPLAMAPSMALAQGTYISVNPTSGPPGAQVTASGGGFPANVTVQIWFDQTDTGARATTDSQGNFKTNFNVPSNATPGLHPVSATDGRENASTPFNVTSPLTVQRVWTGDGNNNATTSFVSAGTIHYLVQVKNSGSTTVTATFTFLATGPQKIFSWSGPGPVAPGTDGFYSPSTIPADAPAGTYTLTVTVTYNGQSSQGQSQFTVKWRNRVNSNPYPDSGQCTWFAEGKMHDVTSLYMPNFGNAQDWRNNAPPQGWTVGSTPETQSVIVMPYDNGYQYSYWDPNAKKWVKSHVDPQSGHVGWVDSLGCGDVSDPEGGQNCVHVIDRNWNEDGKDGQRLIWTGGGAPLSFIYSSH